MAVLKVDEFYLPVKVVFVNVLPVSIDKTVGSGMS